MSFHQRLKHKLKVQMRKAWSKTARHEMVSKQDACKISTLKCGFVRILRSSLTRGLRPLYMSTSSSTSFSSSRLSHDTGSPVSASKVSCACNMTNTCNTSHSDAPLTLRLIHCRIHCTSVKLHTQRRDSKQAHLDQTLHDGIVEQLRQESNVRLVRTDHLIEVWRRQLIAHHIERGCKHPFIV